MNYSTQLSNYFYQLVKENKDNLNLLEFDIDRSMDFNEFDKYIKQQNDYIKGKLNIIKKIYENALYVSCKDFIKIYASNLDEIITRYPTNEYCHMLICPQENIIKSNFYFSLYFLSKYLEKTKNKLEHIFLHIYDAINYKLTDNRIKLLIFTDDFVYSGKQLGGSINKTMNFDTHGVCTPSIFDKNIKIYLNIVGLTNLASRLISECIHDSKNTLIIPKDCIKNPPSFYDTVVKVFNIDISSNLVEYEKKIFIDKYLLTNDINILTSISNNNIEFTPFFTNVINGFGLRTPDISMVYLFCKYPDHFSTFANMSTLIIPYNKCILDLSKINKEIFNVTINNDSTTITPKNNVVKIDIKNISTYDFNNNGYFNEFIKIIKNTDTYGRIDTFYKKIKYKNYNGDIFNLQYIYFISGYFKLYIIALQKQSEYECECKYKQQNEFKNKYIKYKTKYLNLKKNN